MLLLNKKEWRIVYFRLDRAFGLETKFPLHIVSFSLKNLSG